MRARRRALAASAGALLLACTSDPVGLADLPQAELCARMDQALASSSTFGDVVTGPDLMWVFVARFVPGGFGGFFLGPRGTTMWLQAPERLDEVRRVATRASTCRGAPGILGLLASTAEAQQGRFDYVQLVTWYGQLSAALGPDAELTLSDVDEGRNRLTFGFRTDAARVRFLGIVAERGVPTDAVRALVLQPNEGVPSD
jgi:hypothetical protein